MATLAPVSTETLADLLERLGDIPPERVLARPAPGTATEKDAIAYLEAANKRLVELVDGVLVEKPMGSKESLQGTWIIFRAWQYLEANDIGVIFGADGPLRLKKGLLRLPDVSFVSWEQFPDGLPEAAVVNGYPDLAVEVVSKSNTKREVQRKLREYFESGTRLVWVVYPAKETAEVYTSPDQKTSLGKTGILDGGDVLPGFTLPLKEVFERAKRKPRKSG